MRRAFGIAVVVLVVLVAIATGIGAYHAGYTNGLEAGAKAGQVVRVVHPGYGFFPFGFLVFPLLFFGFFWLARAAAWRRWGGNGGPGEWHRRHHERMGQESERPPQGRGAEQGEA
jgi:hypothetical protein